MAVIRLENWSIVAREDAYSAPEIRTQCLSGYVWGHPRFTDGNLITTTRLIGKRGKNVVTSTGTEYQLGKVSPLYEAAFPNAMQRYLDTAPEIA